MTEEEMTRTVVGLLARVASELDFDAIDRDEPLQLSHIENARHSCVVFPR